MFRGNGTIFDFNSSNQSTIVGQANATNAIAVGAVLYTFTPPMGVDDFRFAPASFSSRGGTVIGGSTRNKPDLMAPNGVNTTVDLHGPVFDDGDEFPNFFGTSAAAPHAAAVAALLIDGKKKFQNISTTPSLIKSLLQSTARDMDMTTTTFDYASGPGFIRADSAFRTFAKPTPFIKSMILDDPTLTPGAQAMTIRIRGDYLSNTSQVLLNNVAVPSTFENDTSIRATIPVFSGNPGVRIFTPPMSSSLLDGGYSNTRYFGAQKATVVISADNKHKKYGESLPPFTVTVTVDGQSLAASGHTLADLGLSSLTFQTPANPSSPVGFYFIKTLSPFDSSDAEDQVLLGLYIYDFNHDGVLSIDKLPLVITPQNKTVH